MRWCLSLCALLAALAIGPAYADPLTVTIPAIGVAANIEELTVTDGELSAPGNPDHVGEYQLDGNLLLVGHVDWAGRLRAFSGLTRLANGDLIELSDGRAYRVEWTREWSIDNDADQWAEMIAPGDDVLTLITCTGPFSISRHLYLDRLAVRAVRI